jgi:hypothetical protein
MFRVAIYGIEEALEGIHGHLVLLFCFLFGYHVNILFILLFCYPVKTLTLICYSVITE